MKRPEEDIIQAVWAGQGNPEQAEWVAQWLSTPEGQAYLEEDMQRFIDEQPEDASGESISHSIPSEDMLHNIHQQIQQKTWKQVAFRVAAVLLPFILFIGGFWYVDSKVQILGTPEYAEVNVPLGQRMQVLFQDGTQVHLNAGSQLRYPKKFGLAHRDVYVQGEAYFIVAKEKHRPFQVHVDKSAVRVLGTQFNVKAYAEEKVITLTLDEGSIAYDAANGEGYKMQPHDILLYNKESGACKIIHSAASERLSKWKEEIITFNQTPLERVITELQRWYDVTFIVEDETVYKNTFTITSQRASLESVLYDLEKISHLHFEYDPVHRQVTVKK